MGAKYSIDAKIQIQLQLKEMEKEINDLKRDNTQLRRELLSKLRQQSNQRSKDVDSKQPSEVSSVQIDLIVEKQMNDMNNNLGFVPDFVEKPLRVKAITSIMHSLADIIDTTSIEFMGHEIVMHMQPLAIDPSAKEIICEKEKNEEKDDPYSSYDDEVYTDIKIANLPPSLKE